MGNASSKKSNNETQSEQPNLKTKLDTIAAQLILDTNNEDLIKLLEVTYCNQILKETESILDNNYTKIQLEVINGIITNKPSTIELYTKLNSDDMATSLKSNRRKSCHKKKLM